MVGIPNSGHRYRTEFWLPTLAVQIHSTVGSRPHGCRGRRVGYGMALNTLLQTATTDQYRGRVIATFGTAAALFALIGTLLAGTLGDKIGVVNVLNIDSIGYMGVGILALIAFARLYQRRVVAAAATD